MGVSQAMRPGPRAADAGAAPRPLTVLPADFRTRLGKLSGRFVSAGHAGARFDALLYANEGATEAFAKHAGTFPVGALFIKEHWERGGDGKRGPVMAMEKMAAGFDPAHGDWRFVVVAADGEVVVDGKPEGCVLCHDDAAHDHVFRLGSAP